MSAHPNGYPPGHDWAFCEECTRSERRGLVAEREGNSLVVRNQTFSRPTPIIAPDGEVPARTWAERVGILLLSLVYLGALAALVLLAVNTRW